MNVGGMTRSEVAGASARALMDYIERPPGWNPRPHQIPPPGNWYGWLLNAGRGAGKTRTCSQYIIDHVKGPPCLPGSTPHWIGIIAPTLGDAVTACFSGPSGIGPNDPTARLAGGLGGTVIKWNNGSQAKLFGASGPEDIERLRAGGNTCVIAGTLVKTERGEVPIESVRVGDRVWTRNGLRRVLHTWDNGVKPVWELVTAQGRVLTATADHLIPTARGNIELQHLEPSDKITAWKTVSLFGMEHDGSAQAQAITTADQLHCTEQCGSTHTDQFQTECTSTTKTITQKITTSVISACSPQVSMHFNTWKTAQALVGVRSRMAGSQSMRLLLNASFADLRDGVAELVRHALAENLDAWSNWLSARNGLHEYSSNGCAKCAAINSLPPNVETLERALQSVGLERLLGDEQNVMVSDECKNNASVPFVTHNSKSIRTDHEELVQDHVLSVSETGKSRNVYDLTVEHDHEFFANGIIILNCAVWMEELAAWRHLDACYQQVRFGLRTGKTPRWVASTTPKPRPLIKKLVKQTPHNVVVTHATTHDNPYLEQTVRDELFADYEGTQIGRQELLAEVMEQDENALWRRDDVDLYRVKEAPELVRVTVGVDPSGGAGEQGIVVAGKHVIDEIVNSRAQKRFEGYVLADMTCHLGPAGWGRRAVQAAIDWEADDIVVETNYGGEMAVVTIRDAALAMGVTIPVKMVVATRGKRVRAEPVAALSTRGQWHHVGTFDALEDQLCTWTPELGYSPDRLDAMVWTAWHNKIVATRPRGMGSFAGGGSMSRSIG